jgi:hypothetical protein
MQASQRICYTQYQRMSGMKSFRYALKDRPLFYLPLAVAVVGMFVFLVHYGTNTPYWDQWEMVPLFQGVDHHTLTFNDLWRQHNEHRIFFPNVVLLVSAYVTHWNTGIETLIGLLVATITATLLFVMLKRSIRTGWLSLTAAVVMAAWFFSPVQWENWLWGWQVEWFMCVAGVVASIYLLIRFMGSTGLVKRRVLFGSAMVTAIIATYSLAGGQFVWIIGLMLLLATKQSRRSLVSWVGLGLLSFALYYFHYTQTPTPTGSALHVVFHHPFSFVRFFLTYMGGPVGASGSLQSVMLLFGTIFVLALAPLLYLTWQQRKNLHIYLPWLALILFGLLDGVSTAYGRLGYGLGFASSSRYTAFSLLYLIGLLMLALTLLDHTPKLKFSFRWMSAGTLVLLTLPILISSYGSGIYGFRSHSALLKEIKSCTHAQYPSNACLSLTYPSPSIVRPRLEYLKSKHWAGY